MKLFIFFLFFFSQGYGIEWFPVVDNGRIKPAETIINHQPIEEIKLLPGKKEWYPLTTLKTQKFNFTLYSDNKFNLIRDSFLQWETDKNHLELYNALKIAYEELAGAPYIKAHDKTIYFPSILTLKIEAFYHKIPLIQITIPLYGITTTLLIIGFFRTSLIFLSSAFLIHTLLLAARCFILERPPVSNMLETVLYVPWIAILFSFILYQIFKNRLILIGASVIALVLLILSQVVNQGLENVQPVLDSQFWLIIHVLLVVGSYGVFILGGVLAHLYLLFNKNLGQTILQCLYLGTIMLVAGTILGGIWAAQSWGRFWDWDPKESWAFISICIYLLIIHSYKFGKISYQGLAFGAILGLLAISFTWYGVNYILGTGLHSYGFGSGGQYYYYAYVLSEIAFILWMVKKLSLKKNGLSLKG